VRDAVRRSGTSEPSARLWGFVIVGLNLAGAAWLAIRLAVIEHDGAAGITIAMLAVAIVLGHMRAARAAQSVRKRRLVRHGAMDQRGTSTLVGEAQPVEPGGPAAIETPLEANLIAFSNSTSFVSCHAPKLEADVMSGPHHM
jgi:hypothetical protein